MRAQNAHIVMVEGIPYVIYVEGKLWYRNNIHFFIVTQVYSSIAKVSQFCLPVIYLLFFVFDCFVVQNKSYYERLFNC